jgi:histidine triad (HIT) family protein
MTRLLSWTSTRLLMDIVSLSPRITTPPSFEISEDAFAAVSRSVARVARAVNQAVSPDGLNLVQANGPAAQQSVTHFHVHVLPRRRGDELKLNWSPKAGDPDTIAAIAEKIRAGL